MRMAHLVQSWGVLLALLFCIGTTPSFAEGTGKAGIQLILNGVSFKEVVNILREQSGMKLVMQSDVDADVNLNFPDPTPLDEILTSVTSSLGLEFWKSGDTYYIGKRPAAGSDPVQVAQNGDTIPQVPTTSAGTSTTTTGDASTATTWHSATSTTRATEPASTPKSVSRRVELSHMNVRELMWMLGKSQASAVNRDRRRTLNNRVQSLYGPNHRDINNTNTGGEYTSPALNPFWMNGSTNRDSRTNPYQFFGGGTAGGAVNPGGVAVGGGNPGGAANPVGGIGNNQQNPNNQGQQGQGSLATFLPAGIQDVLGIPYLNAVLVRAESEEAIDQLEQLIKMLDQPVKQVIVEVMFVEMNVEDAISIGTSFDFAGMPISVVSQNGGGEGNFAIRYVEGNFRAVLRSLVTSTRAKVVNAARVVVQNGSSASFTQSESIPFIILSESEDVFGRTIQTPEVDIQEYERGLYVNNIIVHPDNSVTLDVEPLLESPANSVPVPGVDGSSVSGGNEATVQTILRVKDGETMMMGGFVSRNETVGSTRTPLLSNLPVIGPLLFRSVSRSTNNKETVVFLTPIVMKDDTTDFSGLSALQPLF